MTPADWPLLIEQVPFHLWAALVAAIVAAWYAGLKVRGW